MRAPHQLIRHSAAHSISRLRSLISRSFDYRGAMFDVGYFPPNTPPDQSNIAVLPSPKNAASGVQPWTILQ
jgi:hypothetical protein